MVFFWDFYENLFLNLLREGKGKNNLLIFVGELTKLYLNEALAKVFFCGSTSSPRTEKLNNLNLSPFTLSLSKGKLRTFARSSNVSKLKVDESNRNE